MSVLAPNPHILYRETHHREHTFWNGASYLGVLKSNGVGFDRRNYDSKKIEKRNFRVDAMWPDLSRPTSVELEPIQDCDQLDQILLNSQQLSQPIIIDWVAAWCRKCIYLKPKLEKLAAEYDTKIKFYCVDVNKVPQALVKRGNISKMPTIQDDKILDKVLCEKDVGNGVSFFHRIIKLWKDGEMKAEVIGGHKAWLVLDEVREMIQKFR